MIASFLISLFLQFVVGMDTSDPNAFAQVMLITVLGSTIIWISVTFLTQPENEKTLLKFYKKIRPGGKLWKPIAILAPDVKVDYGLGWNLLDWAAGITLIYSALFGVGKIILGSMLEGLGLLVLAVAAFSFIWWDLNRRGWKTWSD
jgi:SSS family solute:Na+ symporter